MQKKNVKGHAADRQENKAKIDPYWNNILVIHSFPSKYTSMAGARDPQGPTQSVTCI